MNNILRFIIWMSLTLPLTACFSFGNQEANNQPRQPIPLFILAGQSNMHGQLGDAAAYPADPLQLDVSIPFYWARPNKGLKAKILLNSLSSSKGWVDLGPQKGLFPAGHFGPEVSFARQLTQTLGTPVAVFKFSLGGAGLAKDWKRPGEKGLYDLLAREYHQVIEQLRQQGKEPEPQALIWIQGEEDAYTPELAAEYQGRLQLMIEDFRENQLGQPQLPVVLGLDEQHTFVVENPQVIAAQEAIAAADPHIIRTSMVGLEKADYTHLTPAGLVEHGDRLADAYLELLQANPD